MIEKIATINPPLKPKINKPKTKHVYTNVTALNVIQLINSASIINHYNEIIDYYIFAK